MKNLILVVALLSPNVRLNNSNQSAILNKALLEASQKLERPFCQEIVNDFNLKQDIAPSLSEYLKLIIFVDGKCKSLMATMPGSRVVWVCKPMNNNGLSTVIIHEMLHTMGLEENPPTPEQINKRVQFRCGK